MALHEVQLKGYSVRPGNLSLGTFDSYGIEQLHVTLDDTWSGLAIDATFHNTPNDKGVTMLVDTDGLVPVPPEACKQPSKYATITFRGVQEGVQRISCNLPYVVLDHAQVPGANSTATPSEIAQALAQMQDLRDGAVDAKNQAEAARDDAAKSAVAAKESETNASQSATAAANSATAAAGSATAAAGDAKTASDAAAGAADAKAAAVAAQKDAAASKAAAANSSAAAKTSEDAAAKSAADADSTANSIKESMTQIAALQKRQNVLVGSETGNPIDVDDAFAAPLCGLTVYGRSTQDGTPTPDAPVPIVSAGDSGNVAVKVTGKNLLRGINRLIAPSEEIEGGVRIVNDTGGNSRLAFFTAELKKGVQYTISYKEKIVQGTNIKVSVYLPKINQYAGYTFIPKQDTDILGIYLNQVQIGTVEVTDIQIELGKTATTYSPYREQLLTLPTPNGLPGIPVTSGGNYTDQNGQQWICDEIDLERGVKVQRVKVLDLLDSNGFDNGGTWHINTKTHFGAGTSYIPVEWFTPVTKCLCNTFPVQMNLYQTGTSADLSIYYSGTGDVISLKSALFNPKGQHATVNEAKAWFTAHPTYLYVPIEPIETPLTPAEIAAYKALTAYAPDTVVQASDGAGVKLEYQRDVNIVIKKFEDAIASMTTTERRYTLWLSKVKHGTT